MTRAGTGQPEGLKPVFHSLLASKKVDRALFTYLCQPRIALEELYRGTFYGSTAINCPKKHNINYYEK
ncbi:hypothetical protein AYI69_g641 [Smittium culicis]|uniref:Uncharacterized protein n=1 Tax=Smittium culicis TaxID=133412 RepID=A0A1R1YSG1_9FUNG|nr:hypothetical protein AYI69_g641 [Smittium culicis]